MTLATGSRLGPYDIVALLGVGGMGEVYRATDTNLKRAVAIKVLPASVATDPERLARFQREAEVLAALNHPHIAAIYGLEKADGVTALVLELVEGPTLADRIAQGPMPLDEALPIAKQIAEALEGAHEQGIIHRDLKPANVKVRNDGTVKVLDFGLAKAMEPTGIGSTPASLANSPTITSPAMMTGVGVILGTAAYMSPEQAKGRPADKRSDIWAFGCVLYEMLMGTRAFDGEDMTEVLGAVVRLEPSWEALPSDVPSAIRTLLQSCLVKDRRRRVADISTVLFVLEKSGSLVAPVVATPIVPPPIRPVWRRALPWVLGALVAGVLSALFVRRTPPVPVARPTRFVLTTPQGALFRSPTGAGIALSPDGSRIVYRSTPGGIPNTTLGGLYLRPVDQFQAVAVRGADSAASPLFSRDGEWIVYEDARAGALKRVPVLGGPPATICPLEGGRLRGASWSPDDTIVFATEHSKGLFRVPASGGTPERLTSVGSETGDEQHWWPDVLPDGRAVLFTSWRGTLLRARVSVVSLPDRTVTHLIDGTSPHYTPSGHLVFATADSALRAVGFDARRLQVVGNAVPVIDRVGVEANGVAHYALNSAGTLVYVATNAQLLFRTLVWVDRGGHREPIKVPPRAYTYARLSPDGGRIALDIRDQENDIWMWDLARQTLSPLTNDPGMNRAPVWTPDGARVAFTAVRDGVESVYWQPFDGSGVMERVIGGTQTFVADSFSPDGKQLVVETGITPPHDLAVTGLGVGREPSMLLHSTNDESNGEVSPDGRWLAYQSNESGREEVYVRPFPNVETARRPVSTGGGTRPVWSKNGRELFYYVAPDTIMAVPVRLSTDLTLGPPEAVIKSPASTAGNSGRHYDVSADGKRFLLIEDAPGPDGQSATAEIRVVLNWFEELKARVPTK